MNTTLCDTPHPLLNWVLRRGRDLLAVQVRRAGDRYEVSVTPPGPRKRLFARRCQDSPGAFQLHAALVAGFRDAGWTSVAYR